MTSEYLQNLKSLLTRMKEADPDFRVFGSDIHGYALGPTLSETELGNFEKINNIVLPADYRLFLKEAGNGGTRIIPNLFMGNAGAGPYYGLLNLEEAREGCELSKPFPFTESTESLSEEEMEWWFDADTYPGIPGGLALCHAGSGIIFWLIVRGEAYGTMWTGRETFSPTGLSFGAWYRAWADKLVHRALPRLANERAIAGKIQLGMTKAEVIAICGGEWQQKEWSNHNSQLSFPHLSTQFELDENEILTRIIAHDVY